MRVTLSQLLEHLGVQRTLAAYETCPWSVSEAGTTISAEVRMSGDVQELEAEIQMMQEDSDETASKQGAEPAVHMQQILWIRASFFNSGLWTVQNMRLKGLPKQDVADWEQKSCQAFRTIVGELEKSVLPDTDDIIERSFYDDKSSGFFGSAGGGGGRGFKMKQNPSFTPKGGGRGF